MSRQFDQFAGDYEQTLDRSLGFSGEDSAYFSDYKARYLARVLRHDFSGKVLDFGCGVGLLSGFMNKRLPAARINGFDVSSESINHVDPVLVQQGLFTSQPESLARDYDLIVTANVMHHIDPAQRRTTIVELAQRLARGGKLVVFEHNPANPLTRWVVERCPFDKDVVLLPPRETASYFTAAKLKVVRRDYIVFMPHFLCWLRGLEPWLASLPFGAQYVLLGEKHE